MNAAVRYCTDDNPPDVEYAGTTWGVRDVDHGLGIGYTLAAEMAAAREPEPDTEAPGEVS